jgi:hypothetical protein
MANYSGANFAIRFIRVHLKTQMSMKVLQAIDMQSAELLEQVALLC